MDFDDSIKTSDSVCVNYDASNLIISGEIEYSRIPKNIQKDMPKF